MGETIEGPWGSCPCGQPGCVFSRFDDDRDGPFWDEEDDGGWGRYDDGGCSADGLEDDDEERPAPVSAEAATGRAEDELLRRSLSGTSEVLASAPEVDVEALVGARVLAALARLWGLGWEPADVVRWAARRRAAWGDDPELVALALGASLSQRAAVDLPQRWRAQVAEHELRLREAPQGFLHEAGADQRSPGWGRYGWRPGWADVCARALLLALGLERQVAMPSIGTARAPGAAGGAGGADPRVLEKVRLLLAKAESSTFPAEAETFTAAAQTIISRHSLEAALAAGWPDEGAGGGPDGVRIGVDGPYEGQKAALLAAVARANRCSAVWMRQLGSSTVVGFAADLAAVEVLFASLLTQAVRGMTAAGADARPGAHTRRPEFRRAYLESFARRIGQRLDEAARDTSLLDGTLLDGTADGERLVPVLAARAAAVDDAVAEAFPDLVSRRGPRSLDSAGWTSGWAAAELASLDIGHAVTGAAALPPSDVA